MIVLVKTCKQDEWQITLNVILANNKENMSFPPYFEERRRG